MPDIGLRFNKDIIVVDGALGTMLQKEGIPSDECGMLLNVLDPEFIVNIHQRYIAAGAQAITTNSFGGTRAKLADYGLEDRLFELNTAAVRLAKQAKAQHVLADVGPCGLVLEPVGSASFDEVFDQYAQQVKALASEGPDAILIETMVDIADARCAVLAARSVCDLPIMVSCTFDATGHMELSGTDPQTAAAILEGVGASVVGLNCGLGPEQSLPLARSMAQATSLPVIIQPNAGLPQLDASGATVYTGTPDEFAYAAVALRDLGVQFIGSCCGSNPAFTSGIYATVGEMDVVGRKAASHEQLLVASPVKTVALGKDLPQKTIGLRIDTATDPELKDQLAKGSLSRVRQLGELQEKAGADLIGIHTEGVLLDGSPALPAAVKALMGFISSPLVLDGADIDALEEALRLYPGRALITGASHDDDGFERVLALAATYGAAVAKGNADKDAPLKIEGCTELKGALAEEAVGELSHAGAAGEQQATAAELASAKELLKEAILCGDCEATPTHVDAVVACGMPAQSIVVGLLTPTLQELGEAFASGEAFLPQMIVAANAMKVAVERIKGHLPETEKDRVAGKVVFCTVAGDVHSIGKDICVALLESQGFEVFDLGVDVSAEEIIAAARDKAVDVICLSALMTTTLPTMKEIVARIYAELPDYGAGQGKAVAVGGAVITAQWAQANKALYSQDAPGCVTLVQQVVAEL